MIFLKRFLIAIPAAVLLAVALFANSSEIFADDPEKATVEASVALVDMNMLILPGTSEYLKSSIAGAAADGAKIVIVSLNTPGGMLPTTQEMIQDIFNSPIPVVVYVSPSGGTATSAGVFITMAAHVAAMAPGTSIGAAHPVSGDGKDIEGDMRAKAENMTIAMVKSISEQRGRNVSWAEKAVKESDSITEKDALKMHVVDVVAQDIDDLLRQLKGRKVKINNKEIELPDYSALPRRMYEPSLKQTTINILANPNMLALLWLAATTGLTIELYNPGAILPGVVGLICLILALAMSQIIPITFSGVLLMLLGVVLISAELIVPSGILGVGGIISIIFGSIYLIDVAEAPGMHVALPFIVTMATIVGALLLFVVYSVVKSGRRKELTGKQGLIGQTARALSNFSGRGKVFVNGEVWSAELAQGIAQKDEMLEISGFKESMLLEVRKKS